MDNLPIAEKIFKNMIARARWDNCQNKSCSCSCPVFRNIQLIWENEKIILDRLRMAYRRIYEYGSRLTLRQLTAHMAYMITSGLQCKDAAVLSAAVEAPMLSNYMFYNRFFGDNGLKVDGPALQLQAIREIRHQGIGRMACPTWERRLWLQTRNRPFEISSKFCTDEFEILRQSGAGIRQNDDIEANKARMQVRRMLYFIQQFENETESFTFFKSFLNSPGIQRYIDWQVKQDIQLGLDEQTKLKRQIMHVLQEQFTGVRLPEGVELDNNLYITLNRRKQEIRQSAQVVLAKFDFDAFSLSLRAEDTGVGEERRNLEFKCLHNGKHACLLLDLPFLDYVMQRNQGKAGESLQASYLDRLERFRAELLEIGKVGSPSEMMLVKLRTNHTFKRQIFAIHANRLEVTNG